MPLIDRKPLLMWIDAHLTEVWDIRDRYARATDPPDRLAFALAKEAWLLELQALVARLPTTDFSPTSVEEPGVYY
jgi:hypothetical protein